MPVDLYIDFVTHSGAVVATYKPENLTFSYNLNDAGSCSWSIGLQQLQVDGVVGVGQDEFAPKRLDYLLRTSNGVKLQAGRLLDVGLESDSGLINCSGRDWLEYLNQPIPFDYSLTPLTLLDDIDNTFYVAVAVPGTDTQPIDYNATQRKIIENILERANTLSDIQYLGNFQGSGWGEVLEYQILYLDQTTMLSHIQALSSYADPVGFDFWCNWNKTIFFHSPRTTPPNSVTTLFDLVYTPDGSCPITKVVWHDTGPKATRTVGKNSYGVWKERFYPPSIGLYRDELEIVELGQKYDYGLKHGFGTSYAQIQQQVDAGTSSVGTLDWNPQKDLSLTVLPDRLPIFPTSDVSGFLPMVGKALSFDSGSMFMPFHRIGAGGTKYYIVRQEYHADNAGNWLLELGLQQIYDNG